jgi:hypothetical protein
MVNGKMCVGILNDELMARIDPSLYDNVLEQRGCREMDFTGKPMKGFVFVGPAGTRGKKDLILDSLALDFNRIQISKHHLDTVVILNCFLWLLHIYRS